MVAEKRPVRRCLGRWERSRVRVGEKPRSRSLEGVNQIGVSVSFRSLVGSARERKDDGPVGLVEDEDFELLYANDVLPSSEEELVYSSWRGDDDVCFRLEEAGEVVCWGGFFARDQKEWGRQGFVREEGEDGMDLSGEFSGWMV
jgi:hypothetical protein